MKYSFIDYLFVHFLWIQKEKKWNEEEVESLFL